ncbi:hypothetical protein Q1695_006432 [Nippostrongylus brasiliensis]|nr:hypothetical protein Q1695_006432 [Nippostrongylus brasiliensis]
MVATTASICYWLAIAQCGTIRRKPDGTNELFMKGCNVQHNNRQGVPTHSINYCRKFINRFANKTDTPTTTPSPYTTPYRTPITKSEEPPNARDRDADWTRLNDKLYKHFPDKVGAAEAERMCRNVGAEMVSIHSAQENDFIYEMTKENSATDGAFDDMVWIGLKLPRGASIEQWYWTDGSAYNFRAWGHMQPESPKDRCTQLVNRPVIYVGVQMAKKWNNVCCSKAVGSVVCMKPVRFGPR